MYKSASKEHNFLSEALHYVQGIVDDIKRAQNSFKRALHDIKRAPIFYKKRIEIDVHRSNVGRTQIRIEIRKC